jgi:hypothetical protein
MCRLATFCFIYTVAVTVSEILEFIIDTAGGCFQHIQNCTQCSWCYCEDDTLLHVMKGIANEWNGIVYRSENNFELWSWKCIMVLKLYKVYQNVGL